MCFKTYITHSSYPNVSKTFRMIHTFLFFMYLANRIWLDANMSINIVTSCRCQSRYTNFVTSLHSKNQWLHIRHTFQTSVKCVMCICVPTMLASIMQCVPSELVALPLLLPFPSSPRPAYLNRSIFTEYWLLLVWNSYANCQWFTATEKREIFGMQCNSIEYISSHESINGKLLLECFYQFQLPKRCFSSSSGKNRCDLMYIWLLAVN